MKTHAIAIFFAFSASGALAAAGGESSIDVDPKNTSAGATQKRGPQTNAMAPAIVGQPQNVSRIAAKSASFSVVATGAAPLSFQWKKGEVSIANATFPDYTITSLQPSHAGSYTVTVSNAFGAVTSSPAALVVPNVLRVSENNPRYFTNNSGRALFLTGSHIWYNIQDQSGRLPLNFQNYLSLVISKAHNFIRLWQMDEPTTHLIDSTGVGNMSPLPFARVSGFGNAADGGLKFDLSKYNQKYFDRLRANVIAAGNEGIYCSVMLFNGWWKEGRPGNFDTSHHNPSNNVNGLSMNLGDVYTLNNPTWVALMDAYAKKVVDTVGDLDNVLYEISNETPYSSKGWQYHVIDYIHAYEITRSKQHPVGMTSFAFASGGYASNADLYSSNAEWISVYGGSGSAYTTDVAPASATKVEILDTDHIWGVVPPGDNSAWVWRGLTRGHNPIYMDPLDYFAAHPPDHNLRMAMGFAQRLANRLDLDHLTPIDSSSSTRYALANLGLEYLVYQPDNSAFTVDLPQRPFNYEWINPGTGDVTSSGTFNANNGANSFALPSGYTKGALLYLTRIPAQIVSITHSANRVELTCSGAPNQAYIIQHAEQVSGPYVDLSGPIMTDSSGRVDYSDRLRGTSQRFYNTRVVP